jgi:hypothetical protein
MSILRLISFHFGSLAKCNLNCVLLNIYKAFLVFGASNFFGGFVLTTIDLE